MYKNESLTFKKQDNMERKLTLTEQVNNLELANKALRNYANELEKKLAKYEHVLARCPRFRAEQEEQETSQEFIELNGEDAPEQPQPRALTIDFVIEADNEEDLEDAYLATMDALQEFVEDYGLEALEELLEQPQPRVYTIDFEIDVVDKEKE